jgi:signal transduction histidine kinase
VRGLIPVDGTGSVGPTGSTTPAGRAGRGRRPVLSARARIVGWCLLLVALALTASVLVAGRVLLARVDSRQVTELAHEGDKLRTYASRSVDPQTGQPFSTTDGLLTAFLRDNVPDADETFFSVVDGRADHRSPQQPLARLDTDAGLVTLGAAADTPIGRTVSTPVGPATIAVFPVRMTTDPRPAALVVVEFLGPQRDEAWAVIRLLALVSFGALAVAGMVGWLVAGRVLRPIRQVRRTAERISESDLTSRIEVTGSDDVAQLARTFNRMLDRLQAAFAAQRDFLNDAGHELRTPLTIVRGHLELLGDDPDERAQTIALLLDEIDRMRRIVEDLTVLAQADQPDFLRLERTDLADVVVDLIAKASAMAPRRWLLDTVAEAQVYADGQRLTQALMQLCANAVAHTGPGDVIAAGSEVSADRMRLWVRDTGSGVPAEDREGIFQRAVRGRNSRSGEGAGLGLAIVSTIAQAHGGTVTLDSAPGAGATFILDLPGRAAPTGTDETKGPGLGQHSHRGG